MIRDLSPSVIKPVLLHSGLVLCSLLLFGFLMIPILTTSGPFALTGLTVRSVSWLVFGVSVFGLLSLRLVAGTFWDPRFFLFVSMVAFNGGQFIGHLLAPDQIFFGQRFTAYRITSGGYFITACLSAWILGMLLLSSRHQIEKERTERPKRSWLLMFGWTFFAIGFLPTMLNLATAIRTVATGGYIALYQGDTQVGLGNIQAVMAGFFLPGIFFLLAAGEHRDQLRRFLLTAAFGVVVINFVLGHRSAAMLPLMALLFVYHYRIKTIPRLPIVASFAGLFGILLPAIAVTRRSNGINLSLGSLSDALRETENPALASLYEMGSSAMTVIYSIMLIPPRPLDWGDSYFRALWTIIPSFGGLNKGLQGGTYADWLINKVDPATASQGGGLGFSAIAETYANFGWHWGPIGFLGLSLLIHTLFARFGNYKMPWHIAMNAIFLNVLMFWPRSEALAMVRPLVWYALIPFVIVLLLHRKGSDAR